MQAKEISKRAMLILDELDLVLLVKVCLLRKGFEVNVVRTIQEALCVDAALWPQIILVDPVIYSNSGSEIKLLEEKVPGVKVIKFDKDALSVINSLN